MKDDMHESINALSAYIQIYRLLIAFCEKYPQIRQDVDNKLYEVIRNPDLISKKNIPSIGEMFPLVGMSTFTWNDLALPLLTEIFDRNVKWLLAKYPELGKINELKEKNVTKIIELNNVDSEKEIIKLRRSLLTKYQELSSADYIVYKKSVDDIISGKSTSSTIHITDKSSIDWKMIDRSRLPKTFEANQVSIKLIMFHVYFLNIFRPINISANHALRSITEIIDRSYGRVSVQLENDFQNQVKFIKDIDNFDKFFKYISIPKPSNEYLLRWLRQSVLNSLRKRYHYIVTKKKVTTDDKQQKNKKKLRPMLNVDDL
jgi:hypothetical protein